MNGPPPRLSGYRRLTLADPRRGGVETFWVRVSDDSFAQWLADRESLAAQGRPDRPPDVDNHLVQVWLPHPGEADLRYFREGASSATHAQWPIATYSWKAYPQRMLLTVTAEQPEGAMRIWLRGTITGGEMETIEDITAPPEAPPAEVGDAVERLVMAVDRGMMPPVEPRVGTYTDYLDIEAECDLARQEIASTF